MTFGTIEFLAVMLIAISAVKIVTLAVSPQSWLDFAVKIYAKPQTTSAVALTLASITLYFLLASGITITQILAVTLFIALLTVAGIAPNADRLIETMKNNTQLSGNRLYATVWTLLLLWGIREIFFG